MLITHRPDGSTLIELTGRQFQDKYKAAPVQERVVMADKRPAVRTVSELGVTYYTILEHLWEMLRYLPRNRPKVENRVMRCDACQGDMTVTHEYDGGGKGAGFWTFACDRCKSREIWSKDIVGGTKGGGEKETL